jgi:hypothetical protein
MLGRTIKVGFQGETGMKKFLIASLASASLLAVSFSLAAQKPQTFTGEIMDQQCALLGGHSLMQQKGESPKDCTIRCVGMGGKYVLFDAGSKTVYQLDDQKKPQAFAGDKVQVTGTYDASSKTIHVSGIKAAS